MSRFLSPFWQSGRPYLFVDLGRLAQSSLTHCVGTTRRRGNAACPKGQRGRSILLVDPFPLVLAERSSRRVPVHRDSSARASTSVLSSRLKRYPAPASASSSGPTTSTNPLRLAATSTAPVPTTDRRNRAYSPCMRSTATRRSSGSTWTRRSPKVLS
jgi:hypothetical protein